jgi:hypothetical protein
MPGNDHRADAVKLGQDSQKPEKQGNRARGGVGKDHVVF